MFAATVDVQSRALVWVSSGDTNADADWQRFIDTIVSTDVTFAGRYTSVLHVVDAENPVPNAYWRSRIVQATMSFRAKPAYALVLSSTMARLVAQTILMVRPAPYEQEIVRTIDDGITWLRQKRGVDREVLERLYLAARAESQLPASAVRLRSTRPAPLDEAPDQELPRLHAVGEGRGSRGSY